MPYPDIRRNTSRAQHHRRPDSRAETSESAEGVAEGRSAERAGRQGQVSYPALSHCGSDRAPVGSSAAHAAHARAWKVLQNELHGKPKRRTKGFDEWFSRFSGTSPESNEVRRRRASRHIELGAPLESPPIAPERPRTPRTLSGGMTLAQLRRLELEEARTAEGSEVGSASGTSRPGWRGVIATDRFHLERGGPLRQGQVRAVESRDTGREWAAGREVNAHTHTHGPGDVLGTTATTTTTTTTTPRPVLRPHAERAYTSPAGRHGPLRSNALIARQARGHRSNSIVETDSDSDTN